MRRRSQNAGDSSVARVFAQFLGDFGLSERGKQQKHTTLTILLREMSRFGCKYTLNPEEILDKTMGLPEEMLFL